MKKEPPEDAKQVHGPQDTSHAHMGTHPATQPPAPEHDWPRAPGLEQRTADGADADPMSKVRSSVFIESSARHRRCPSNGRMGDEDLHAPGRMAAVSATGSCDKNESAGTSARHMKNDFRKNADEPRKVPGRHTRLRGRRRTTGRARGSAVPLSHQVSANIVTGNMRRS